MFLNRCVKATFMALALSLLLVPTSRGGTNAPCPVINIKCIEGEPCGGVSSKLTVEVMGAGPNVIPTYKWCVSAGMIISGQGTDTIEIESSGTDEEWITVVIIVGGLDRSCDGVDSHRIEIKKRAA